MTTFQIEEKKAEKTYIIFPNITNSEKKVSPEARLEEAIGLAHAINLDVVGAEITKLREVKSGAFFGQGFIDKLAEIFKQKDVGLLIVDSSLSPIQQRNLEKKLKIKVIDRTALILEIFGERAQTKEGKLQVELAHLTYQRSRLVRSWTHLERQRGGAGFLGGPGETQIELDRRIIDEKIVRIKKELEKVKKTRALQRGARQKVPYPVVALVGYTNAGKSTLFNRLSQANVFAKDLLFATLDTTMRKVKLPTGQEAIFSDTVGFISDLPHELIMAFRATLEEVLSADIVVHVRDIANPETQMQKKDVLGVLEHLGLKHIETEENYIELLNKADLLSQEQENYYKEQTERNSSLILCSAANGQGMDKFLKTVASKLSREKKVQQIDIAAENGKEIAWLYENAEVLSKEIIENNIRFKCKISNKNFARLEKMLQKNK